jgi:hypothetical protein
MNKAFEDDPLLRRLIEQPRIDDDATTPAEHEQQRLVNDMALHSRSYRFTPMPAAAGKAPEPEATIINNLNATALLATVQKFKENPEAGRNHVSIKATMNASEGLARVNLPAGELVTAWPRVFGGRGKHLSPHDLCTAGLSGCFTGTFMVLLAQAGIRLAADTQIEPSFDWNFEGFLHSPDTSQVCSTRKSAPSSEPTSTFLSPQPNTTTTQRCCVPSTRPARTAPPRC